MPALVRELLAAPGAQDDVERLVEDRARLVDGHAEHAVLRELVAAPHADVDAAAGDVVEQRHPLDEAQRVGEGQVDDRGADPHAPRARRQVAGQQERVARETVGREVLLGHPDVVEAERLRQLGACQLLPDHLVRRAARAGTGRRGTCRSARALLYTMAPALVVTRSTQGPSARPGSRGSAAGRR